MNLSKVILIAGATSMIGQACCYLLAQKDNQLILLGRDDKRLEDLANKFDGTDIYKLDFALESEITSCIKNIIDKYGRIDAVIYNTAIYPCRNVDALSISEWQSTLDINLTGAFLLTKMCTPIMKKQTSGKFIFISSIAGELMGLANMSAYAASKAGLNGFMRTLAIELAPFNINVNSVSPGKVYDVSTLAAKEIIQKTNSIPLKRFIEPIDIAHMVEFLISEKGKNITGQNIIVDGGQTINN